MRPVLISALLVATVVAPAFAQATAPAVDEVVESYDVSAQIAIMRDAMVDAFNKGDLDRLLSHTTPDVVVTWQNAEVSHGAAEVRAYHARMMSGPDRIVQSVTASPTVEGRDVHGDWVISWGRMNDRFVLTDGRDLALDSRFSAVLVKAEGAWKVREIHLSTNAFGGAIVQAAIATTAKWTGLAAGGGGLLVGLVVGRVWSKRKSPATS